jgi:Winged helix DNA-binding domain
MPRLDICGQRLANQQLGKQTVDKPSEVVRVLGAVQAQDYPFAKWGLAQRTRGATDAMVEKELDDGVILRTHVLRPTWHFVAAADIRWMLALTGPRVRGALASYDRTLGLDEAVIRRSRAVITKALQGGKQLTRAELALAMQRARIPTDGPFRLARLVMHAESDALICSGARRGKQFTYALLEERVPPAKPLDRDEALSELAKRYFHTRGPATVDDFAWWSGLTKSDARRGVQAVESDLEHLVIGARAYWFPTSAPFKARTPFARLLPNYDEYFIGLKDRSAMMATLTEGGVKGVTFLGGHILTINGQIRGGWTRILKGQTAIIELKVHGTLTAAEHRAVAKEVKRFGVFLGLPAKLGETTHRALPGA